MEGCKNRCIFCDQKAISGENKGPSEEEITRALEAVLKGLEDEKGPSANYEPLYEVAFYGGSFSALPQSRQEYYLRAVKPYYEAGRLTGLRVSTHPGAINREKLALLKNYGVKTIELGVQSFNDDVLAAAGRGYTGQEAAFACNLIKEEGFDLGIQLMTGLPEDSPSIALESAFRALEIKPAMARLYPTLVLPNTPLAGLWSAGKYRPQSLEEAVSLARDIYACFKLAGLPLIRMGLNPSQNLEEAVLAGPYHPAFGSLVICALKKLELKAFFKARPGEYKELIVPKGQLPLFTGPGKTTRQWLLKEQGIGIIKENSEIPKDTFKIIAKDNQACFCREYDFLKEYCQKLKEKIKPLGL